MTNPIALSNSSSNLRITRRKLYVAMLAASQLMAAGKVMAAPTGGAIVGGAGAIDQSGLNTTIHQASERMAIDWQSFDVKADERVQFIQPKSTSVALNRVLTNKVSQIMGRIDANGQVFLVNPNGVVFGKGSQINVGGIVASGLSINPNDFMNGEYTLTALEGTDGKVINSGVINAATGGSVTLVGQQVQNDGLISANLGSVSLAAGKEAVVSFDKAGLVGVKVTKEVLQNELGVDAAVLNSGDINAQGGRILITASVSQDIFSDAVNNGGMNKASSVVVNEDGSFTLGAGADVVNTGNLNTSTEVGDAGQVVVIADNINHSGNITANANHGTAGSVELHSTNTTMLESTATVTAKALTQGVGGDVKVLGDKVGLIDHALVDASGANGGGQVLIGGDETGANHQIRNASFIYLGESTNAKADGLINGDGGKLITFASDTARIYGELSARGGSQGGNGGFVETSGLKGFEITSTPDVRAAAGHGGMWLIDPDNIKIIKGDSESIKDEIITPDVLQIFTPTGDDAKLNVDKLEGFFAMTGGTTAIVRTGNSGDITLEAPLNYNFSGGESAVGSNTLRFEADGSIYIKGTIKNEIVNGNILNIELHAKNAINIESIIETKGGSFKTVSGAFNSALGSINTTGYKTSDTVGDVKILANGTVNLGAITTKNLSVLRDTNLILDSYIDGDKNKHVATPGSAAITLSQQGIIKATGDTIFDVGGGAINLGNSDNDFTSLQIKSAASALIKDKTELILKTIEVAGNLNLTAGGAISQGTDTSLNIKGKTTLSAVSKSVKLTNAGNDFMGVVTTGTSVGSLSLTDINKLTLGKLTITDAGDVANSFDAGALGVILTDDISSKGNLTFKESVTSTQPKLNITGNDITFDKDVGTANARINNLTLNATENITAKNFFVTSLGVSAANGFVADSINTYGIGALGGEVIFTATTGTVKIGSIKTQSTNTLPVPVPVPVPVVVVDPAVPAPVIDPDAPLVVNANGANGANVIITGGKITLGTIDTSGATGTGTGATGTAGVVTINGTSAVTLQGDINATAANVSVGGGVVKLDYVDVFNSVVTLEGKGSSDILIGPNIENTWSITGPNSGSILKTDQSPNIKFSNFENLTGGTYRDLFLIKGDGNVSGLIRGKAADVTPVVGAIDEVNIEAATGNRIFSLDISDEKANLKLVDINTIIGNASPSTSLHGFADGGQWSITEANGGKLGIVTFNNVANLVGRGNKDSKDTFTFFPGGSITGEIVGSDNGKNILVVEGRENYSTDWSITGKNSGTVSLKSLVGGALPVPVVAVTSFTKIQNLQGSIQNDNFFYSATSSIVNIDGMDGVNAINLSAITDGRFYTLANATNISTIIGDNNTLILQAGDGENAWTIDGENSGTLGTLKFYGFKNIKGGTGDDTFTLKEGFSIGSINGGDTLPGSTKPSDTIKIADFKEDTPLTFTLGSSDSLSVQNISKFEGNSSDLLTLNAGDGDKTWFIKDHNTGEVEVDEKKVTFSGFNNLEGGAGKDTFDFSESKTGLFNIVGGDNVNVIKGRNAESIENTWNITADGNTVGGATTYASFSGISTLVGGSGVDIFDVKAQFLGTIMGGAGNDIFNIQAATVGLYGEAGADTFDFSVSLGSAEFVDGGSFDKGDKLIARYGANTWNLDNEKNTLHATALYIADNTAAYVAGFKNIEVLQGGATGDNFLIKSDVAYDIKAGAGYNTFKISADINYGLVGGLGDDTFIFLGTGKALKGIDGAGGTNKIIARDVTNTWTIGSVKDKDNGFYDASIVTGETGNGTTYLAGGFKNIQILEGGSGIDIFNINAAFSGTIQGGAGNDVFNINAAATDLKLNLFGGLGNDIFDFGVSGSVTSINGASDFVGPIATEFNTIKGKDLESTWQLTSINSGTIASGSASPVIFASFTNIQALEGKGSVNTLVGAGINAKWDITGENAGTLSFTDTVANGEAAPNLSFKNMQNLQGGNDAADSFNFSGNAKITGLINGGTSSAGDIIDEINFKAMTGNVNVYLGGDADNSGVHIRNIESITANTASENNTLTGSSEANGFAYYSWVITGNDAGSIGGVMAGSTEPASSQIKTNFTGFNVLKGGAFNDNFSINSKEEITTNIDGGKGTDLIDYSNNAADVNITLGGNNSFGVGGISGIEGILGNGSGVGGIYKSTISIANNDTEKTVVWQLKKLVGNDGINDGSVSIDGTTISFENFNVINGSAGDDTFNLDEEAKFIGTINGGEGENIFDATDSGIAQTITLDHVDSKFTNLTNIQTVLGNAESKSILIGTNQTNDWQFVADNKGTINKSEFNKGVTFSGFHRVAGGAGVDTFNINDIDGLKIIIDGGDGNAADNLVNLTALNLTELTDGVTIGVGEDSSSDISIVNINKINANPDASNTLVSNDKLDNIWDITAVNNGTLNNVLMFEGFKNLQSGNGTDSLSFKNSAANITGIIDLGAGSDTVNFTDAGRDLNVQILDAEKTLIKNSVNITNVENIQGSIVGTSTLTASNTKNSWSIAGPNAGTVSVSDDAAAITFSRFANLVGGTGEDAFVIGAAGSLTGYISGGGIDDVAKDLVDVSALENANITLGSDGNGYRNIEKYIGNNTSSILTGDNNGNTWTLNAEQNTGDINDKISFSGFVSLNGGSGNDIFNLTAGNLTGSIFGGAGNDTFNVGAGFVAGNLEGGLGDDTLTINLAAGSASRTRFVGGDDTGAINGTDSISVTGGDSTYKAAHASSGSASGELSYVDATNNGFSVLYSGVSLINDDVIASLLTLNNTVNPDVFSFTGNGYSLNTPLDISYSNKANLVVAAAADDKVLVSGAIDGLESLTIQNAALASTAAGLINVKSLILQSVAGAGDSSNRLNLDVNNLSVVDAAGDIYVNQDKNLIINDFTNNKGFDLSLLGDLTTTEALASSGDIAINATGKIDLLQDNALTGNIGLVSGSDINIKNIGVTNLANIKSQNLHVNSTGAINGAGEIIVTDMANLASDSNIVVSNAANDFNKLIIEKAINASVVNSDMLTLSGINASGVVDVVSSGAEVNGAVDVAGLSLNAGQASALLGANVTAVDSVSITGHGITADKSISAASVTLDGAAGDVAINGIVDTANRQSIVIKGSAITQNVKIVSGENIEIEALGDLLQNADIETVNNVALKSGGDLTTKTGTTTKADTVNYSAGGAMNLFGNVVAINGITIQGVNQINQSGAITTAFGDIDMVGGDIVMASEAISASENGAINYRANNIALGLLNAKNGSVLLTAVDGAITDSNGLSLNVDAINLDASATKGIGNTVALTGVGLEDALEASVSRISLSNTQGNISVINNKEVTIDQLRANGNINFQNLFGDVLLANQPPIGGDYLDRPPADTVYATEELRIKVDAGNLLASDLKNLNMPEIKAATAKLYVSGTIGVLNRPLVIDSKVVIVSSRRTWRPTFLDKDVQYFDEKNSSISPSDISATNREQMVQVETLAEVNPAIFTGVRNYVYDDVAILLPEDQRYDDSEE